MTSVCILSLCAVIKVRCDLPPAPGPSPPPPQPPRTSTTVNFTLHYADSKNGAFAKKENWHNITAQILDYPVDWSWPGR